MLLYEHVLYHIGNVFASINRYHIPVIIIITHHSNGFEDHTKTIPFGWRALLFIRRRFVGRTN